MVTHSFGLGWGVSLVTPSMLHMHISSGSDYYMYTKFFILPYMASGRPPPWLLLITQCRIKVNTETM